MPQKNHPQMDWLVCADESQWINAQSQPVVASPVGARHRQWPAKKLLWPALFSTLILAFVTCMGGWWLWQQAEEGIANVESEIAASVQAEFWKAGTTGDFSGASWQEQIFLKAMDLPANHSKVIVGVEVREIDKEWAIVDVSIVDMSSVNMSMQPTTDGPRYRQTRIYHHSEAGWLRAAPAAERWGAVRTEESRYFVFRYRTVDEEAVRQAVARIDALNQSLYASVAGEPPPTAKQTILVDVEKSPGVKDHFLTSSGEVIVASAAATMRPAEVTAGDLLLQSVMLALNDGLTAKLPQEGKLPSDDEVVRYGLGLWLMWGQELPLAGWREAAVKRVFLDANQVAKEKLEIPVSFRKLCLQSNLWMRSPLEIGIPVICLSPNMSPNMLSPQVITLQDSYTNQGLSIAPLLDNLTLYGDNPMLANGRWGWPGYGPVVLATAFEYIAAGYGGEKIPQVLAALSKHQKAETLIPAVLGVSIPEFDAGWRAFLLKRYRPTP